MNMFKQHLEDGSNVPTIPRNMITLCGNNVAFSNDSSVYCNITYRDGEIDTSKTKTNIGPIYMRSEPFSFGLYFNDDSKPKVTGFGMEYDKTLPPGIPEFRFSQDITQVVLTDEEGSNFTYLELSLPQFREYVSLYFQSMVAVMNYYEPDSSTRTLIDKNPILTDISDLVSYKELTNIVIPPEDLSPEVQSIVSDRQTEQIEHLQSKIDKLESNLPSPPQEYYFQVIDIGGDPVLHIYNSELDYFEPLYTYSQGSGDMVDEAWPKLTDPEIAAMRDFVADTGEYEFGSDIVYKCSKTDFYGNLLPGPDYCSNDDWPFLVLTPLTTSPGQDDSSTGDSDLSTTPPGQDDSSTGDSDLAAQTPPQTQGDLDTLIAGLDDLSTVYSDLAAQTQARAQARAEAEAEGEAYTNMRPMRNSTKQMLL